jgi:hypothetical protein
MEEKFLIVKFHKGVTYKIPAVFIARNRAYYYKEVDGYEEDSQEYLDEVNFALEDEFELFDWVHNNMNWSDLKDVAIRFKEEDEFDPEEEWDEGNHTISVNW